MNAKSVGRDGGDVVGETDQARAGFARKIVGSGIRGAAERVEWDIRRLDGPPGVPAWHTGTFLQTLLPAICACTYPDISGWESGGRSKEGGQLYTHTTSGLFAHLLFVDIVISSSRVNPDAKIR